MDPINLDGVQLPSTLPYERDGRWYWPDETWQEHGPCSSQESAQRRQDCYCAVTLEGSRQHVPAADWQAKKGAEAAGTTHPCNVPCAWDCACSGACSCHWIDADAVLGARADRLAEHARNAREQGVSFRERAESADAAKGESK